MKLPAMLHEMIAQNDMCVLATVAEGGPLCSLMAYVHDDGCSRIYLVTSRNSRKFRNVEYNPRVSLLIDTRHRHLPSGRRSIRALTVQGIVRAVAEPDRESRIAARFEAAHPHLQAILEEPQRVFLEVKVTSLLLLDGPSQAHYFEVPLEPRAGVG